MKKKYIVTIAGGLGNQMLQYGLYVYLKKKGYKCDLYLKPEAMNDHHGFGIEELFQGIQIPRNNYFINSYLNFYTFLKKGTGFLNRRLETNTFNFLYKSLPVQIINFPNWQDYTFFNEIDPESVGFCNFPEFTSEKNKKISGLVNHTTSISIHIRRGDYVNSVKWRKILGDICDLEYYNRAIKKIKELVNDPVFLVFSDDISWTKSNLQLPDAIYIEGNNGDESFRDMQLMANCKHNIIANSTFSLMGAWLNRNPDKIVIGPGKWRNYHNDQTGEKFIPENWITIDNFKPNVSINVRGQIEKKDVFNILNQTYTDFELLIDTKYYQSLDDRIRNSDTPCGNHIFEYENYELDAFSDRDYLTEVLNSRFKKIIDESITSI